MTRALPPPDAVLGVASEVVLRLEAGGALLVTVGGRSAVFPTQALAILTAAQRPRTLRQLLADVGAGAPGAVAWIETTALVAALLAHGALTDRSTEAAAANVTPARGREIEMHIELLDDTARTRRFIDALARCVRPGDVVVDLGSGNGILALAAARAGARRVYAIEASPFAAVTERIVHDNGYADCITVVRGWSHEVVLPERADVLVSELIGNDPLGEGVLRYVPDAVQRFLKPGGIVLPARLEVDLMLAELPEDLARQHHVGAERLVRWRADYGFDFGALSAHAEASTRRLHIEAANVAHWRRLSDPHPLFATDLLAALPPEATVEVVLRAKDSSPRPALVLGTTLRWPDGVTDPGLRCAGHWRVPVLLLPAGTAARGWTVRARWGALCGEVALAAEPLA